MTKLTRSDLKAIVKECLIEILTEGIGGSLPSTSVKKSIPQRGENPYLEERHNPKRSKVSHASSLQEFIRKEAGGNKVMEDIFADTAESTLPKILQGESRGSMPVKHTLEEQIVASANPEDLFGEEAASKWANYAFANVTKK